MSLFQRTPPPKKQLPAWFGIITPVIMAIILGLTGIVYNGVAGELKDLKTDKADKQYTYEKIEANQAILQQNQSTLKEALDSITKMQADREAREKLEAERIKIEKEKAEIEKQKLQIQMAPAPPRSFKVIEPDFQMRPVSKEQECERPALSPKEFKEYLQLNTEERAAFRKLHPSYATLPK